MVHCSILDLKRWRYEKGWIYFPAEVHVWKTPLTTRGPDVARPRHGSTTAPTNSHQLSLITAVLEHLPYRRGRHWRRGSAAAMDSTTAPTQSITRLLYFNNILHLILNHSPVESSTRLPSFQRQPLFKWVHSQLRSKQASTLSFISTQRINNSWTSGEISLYFRSYIYKTIIKLWKRSCFDSPQLIEQPRPLCPGGFVYVNGELNAGVSAAVLFVEWSRCFSKQWPTSHTVQLFGLLVLSVLLCWSRTSTAQYADRSVWFQSSLPHLRQWLTAVTSAIQWWHHCCCVLLFDVLQFAMLVYGPSKGPRLLAFSIQFDCGRFITMLLCSCVAQEYGYICSYYLWAFWDILVSIFHINQILRHIGFYISYKPNCLKKAFT